MSICEWIVTNLGTLGLIFDVVGAVWMVGNRFWVSRTFGIWLSPIHGRRMNAYQVLLKNGRIENDTEGFNDFRELIAPDKFVESQKFQQHYGLEFTHIKKDGSQIVVHADETSTPSNINNDINFRRELSGVDDTMERAFEKLFLYDGVTLLVIGFSLQIASNLFVG